MNDLLKITLLGLFFGTFGTTLGGIIGIKFKNPSNKFLSFILSLASGLMTAIVSFDLIPEALKIAPILNTILGVILGIICMIICNIIVDKKFNNSHQFLNSKVNNKQELLRTGIITSIGLAIHNFPEGLAIGSGFGASLTLGYSLAIAICIHDIPEGISMAVPMKNGGMKAGKVLFYVILSGVTTGIGAFIGKIIGGISQDIIALCLTFAAGAMLYIVSGELIPESNKLYNGKISTLRKHNWIYIRFISSKYINKKSKLNLEKNKEIRYNISIKRKQKEAEAMQNEKETTKKIMFICTGNTCRSVMAEGLFKKMLKDKQRTNIEVYSSGLHASTGEYTTDEAVKVMQEEYEVNILQHQSINVKNSNIKNMDLILCATHAQLTTLEYMYPDLDHKIFTIKEYAYGPEITDKDIKDPWGYPVSVYRDCAKEIYAALNQIIDKI